MPPTWQQEMGWYCGTCKKLNRGRYKECQNCGKPKEREPFVDLPGEGEGIEWAVKDPELIKQAKAGADWECTYCHSHQRRDSGECAVCGSDPKDSGLGPALRAAVKASPRSDFFTPPPPEKNPVPIVSLLEELREEEAALEAVKDMGYRGRRKRPDLTEDTAAPVELPVKKPWWGKKQKTTGVVLLSVALVGLLLFLLLRPRIVDATVTATQWQYLVHVERYQIVRDEGFNESEPGDAFDVQPVGMRHHHYRQVPDGTREVPYQESYQCGESCTTTPVRCTSNNNGFKSCSGGDRVCSPKYCSRTKYRTETKYRDESVERMWYRWKVWRWKLNRTVAESGTDLKPFWPSDEKIGLRRNLGPEEKDERERREPKFLTVFTDAEGKTHNYEPKSLGEFQNLPRGIKKRLKVRIVGSPEILPN